MFEILNAEYQCLRAFGLLCDVISYLQIEILHGDGWVGVCCVGRMDGCGYVWRMDGCTGYVGGVDRCGVNVLCGRVTVAVPGVRACRCGCVWRSDGYGCVGRWGRIRLCRAGGPLWLWRTSGPVWPCRAGGRPAAVAVAVSGRPPGRAVGARCAPRGRQCAAVCRPAARPPPPAAAP